MAIDPQSVTDRNSSPGIGPKPDAGGLITFIRDGERMGFSIITVEEDKMLWCSHLIDWIGVSSRTALHRQKREECYEFLA
jgi:hypothetical protein